MLLYNASKKIESLLNVSIQKIVSPKSPKDTIYGTFLALALLEPGSEAEGPLEHLEKAL